MTRRPSAGPSGSGSPAAGGRYDNHWRIIASAVASSGATLWINPLARATAGPPRVAASTSSPSEAFTSGGPAAKMAARSVITEKSAIGAARAP
ncbi:MAG: hypothetical protein V9E89_10290 [Ilumatobacteraceae bacterium]